MNDDDGAAVRLRRLRAALGVSADALLGPAGSETDPAALLADEVEFLVRIGPGALPAIWRELRTRALALAAELPASDESVALLAEQLARDEARLRAPH